MNDCWSSWLNGSSYGSYVMSCDGGFRCRSRVAGGRREAGEHDRLTTDDMMRLIEFSF